MTAEIPCTNSECDQVLDVEFEVEKGEERTWMYPGSDANVWVTRTISKDCDCVQDKDEQSELLLQYLFDHAD